MEIQINKKESIKGKPVTSSEVTGQASSNIEWILPDQEKRPPRETFADDLDEEVSELERKKKRRKSSSKEGHHRRESKGRKSVGKSKRRRSQARSVLLDKPAKLQLDNVHEEYGEDREGAIYEIFSEEFGSGSSSDEIIPQKGMGKPVEEESIPPEDKTSEEKKIHPSKIDVNLLEATDQKEGMPILEQVKSSESMKTQRLKKMSSPQGMSKDTKIIVLEEEKEIGDESESFGSGECRRFRGLYRDPLRFFQFGKDYRDPEPPPLDDKTLRKIFFPKEMTEDICKGELSKEVLLSQTELRDQIKTVMKGSYKTVTSVTDAVRLRNHLLQNIPKRSPREMRRLTMPPSQSLLLELEEEGYMFSRNTLERFMNLDDDLIKLYEQAEQSKLCRKPLRQNKYYLIVLSEALKLVEVYNKYGRKKEIYSLYMYLGQFFQGLHDSWLWLTYELYNLAVDVVSGYKNDLGFGEAIVRYTLGKFCLEKLKDPEEALPHFQAAYNVSHGRNWTTEPLTNNKEEVIHMRSSYMIHVASLMIANEIIDTDPKRATDLGFSALKRIVETGIHYDIEDALRALANLYQKAKRPETAIIVINRQIKQSKSLKDYDGIINGYFMLAYCYRAMKKYDKAYESLKIMDELAAKHGDRRFEAMACKYLGEYHLSLDDYKNSERYFHRAIKKFLEVGLVNDAYKCSVHAGAVKAALNMSVYVDLILGVSTTHDLHSLIEWQLSEDPALWDKLTYSFRHKELAENKQSKLERRTISRSMQYQTLVPNHPRIRNSICNLSDIHIVNSATELD